MFRIPLLLFPEKFLDRTSSIFAETGKRIAEKNKKFQAYFLQANIPLKPEKYLAICLTSFLFDLIFLTAILLLIFYFGKASLIYAPIISIFLSIFIIIQQVNYPKVLVAKKVRNIEANLLPALRAMSVQLTAGVTFFNALKNISRSKYGVISEEFQKAINSMESGTPTLEALERVSQNNPSIFFRRTVWQIMTGMGAGADISNVLREIVKSLNQEQITEIQAYGGKLAPLSMFYMVIAIIFPALAVTFILVLSTFVQTLGENYKTILFGVMGMVVLLQIIFLGMIKSGRPPLI
jgi:pilus assembly protein TadC